MNDQTYLNLGAIVFKKLKINLFIIRKLFCGLAYSFIPGQKRPFQSVTLERLVGHSGL